MTRFRCVRSSMGARPTFVQGHLYELVTEFNFGGKGYLRLRASDGAEMNADSRDFFEVGSEDEAYFHPGEVLEQEVL